MAIFKGPADPEFIRERYRNLLSEAKLRWAKDCGEVATEMQLAGRWGSGAMIMAMCNAFATRAREGLDRALGETSNTIGSRGSAWNKALDALSEIIETEFADVEAAIIYQCEGTQFKVPDPMRDQAKKTLATTIAGLIAELEAYRVGWSSPKPEKFTERHPVLWPIILILIGTVIGLLADPVKDGIIAPSDAPVVTQPTPANSPTRSP